MYEGGDEKLTQTQLLALWSANQTAVGLPRDVLDLAKDLSQSSSVAAYG